MQIDSLLVLILCGQVELPAHIWALEKHLHNTLVKTNQTNSKLIYPPFPVVKGWLNF